MPIRWERRAPSRFTNTLTTTGTLVLSGLTKSNYGEAAFNAPPFVPGFQEGIGVDVLDNHTAMHEAIFVVDGSNTHIWEYDTDNSAAIAAIVGTDVLHGGFTLVTGGSSGHQTAVGTAATNYICTVGKPWWIKTRFNLDDHDVVEFFFGLTEDAIGTDSWHLVAAGADKDRVGFVKAVHSTDAVTFAATKNTGGAISTALDTPLTYDIDLSVLSLGIHWDGVDSIKFYANKVASAVTPGEMALVHTYSTAAGISDVNLRLVLMLESGGAAETARIEYIKGAYTK